jgi:hypothetical protein
VLLVPARHHVRAETTIAWTSTQGEVAMQHRLCSLSALALLATFAASASGAEADLTAGLKKGTVELKSAGPLAFGPQGILFIGDPAAAAIHAVDTGDRTASESKDRPKVEGIDEKIASLLGAEASDIRINDLAVNPISGTTYLSVARGRGPKATAVVLSVTRGGKVAEVPLKDVKSATATIPNAAEGRGRQEAITQLAYVKGRVLVAGLSNEEFASKLRSIPFPFDKTEKGKGTSVEIYHGAHGQFETRAPVRVFAPYQIKGEDNLLAAYTCTPLVKFPVSDLKPGEKIRGTTVAELGNRNRPLSMIVYHKGGKDYVLMANNARGLMKIALEGVDKAEGITDRIKGTAGLKYETIKSMGNKVQKLDAFGKEHALLLVRADGKLNLETIELP